ncbi:hypothetical protein GOODEAATRI_010013, partial [Goodea atripinnis]
KADVELEKRESPLSDASKKRLIEDTEDWHPRTGTSQSRSFRILAQMTGTEKDKYVCRGCTFCKSELPLFSVYIPELTQRPVEGSLTLLNHPYSAITFIAGLIPDTKPFKIMGSIKTGGFAKVGAGPSFGKIVSPPQKGPDRPNPQPHPEDLNSLVQRAEHIPAEENNAHVSRVWERALLQDVGGNFVRKTRTDERKPMTTSSLREAGCDRAEFECGKEKVRERGFLCGFLWWKQKAPRSLVSVLLIRIQLRDWQQLISGALSGVISLPR